MALPKKLKHMNLFNDGNSYLGVAKSATLPTLARKMEAYRGGGMDGPVKVDLGHSDDGLQFEWTLGGWDLIALRQFGAEVALLSIEDTTIYDDDELSLRERDPLIERSSNRVS